MGPMGATMESDKRMAEEKPADAASLAGRPGKSTVAAVTAATREAMTVAVVVEEDPDQPTGHQAPLPEKFAQEDWRSCAKSSAQEDYTKVPCHLSVSLTM